MSERSSGPLTQRPGSSHGGRPSAPAALQFRKNHPHARPSRLRCGDSGATSASTISASRCARATKSAVALSAAARAAAQGDRRRARAGVRLLEARLVSSWVT